MLKINQFSGLVTPGEKLIGCRQYRKLSDSVQNHPQTPSTCKFHNDILPLYIRRVAPQTRKKSLVINFNCVLYSSFATPCHPAFYVCRYFTKSSFFPQRQFRTRRMLIFAMECHGHAGILILYVNCQTYRHFNTLC